MAAQCGAAIVVSVKDAAGTYQVLAGLRSRKITLNAETVDVTNADSTGRWREILDGCGVRSASFSGDGVFLDDAGANASIDAMMNNNNRSMKILVPGLGTFEGAYKLSQVELAGAYNGEVTYSLSLESAGVIAYTGA